MEENIIDLAGPTFMVEYEAKYLDGKRFEELRLQKIEARRRIRSLYLRIFLLVAIGTPITPFILSLTKDNLILDGAGHGKPLVLVAIASMAMIAILFLVYRSYSIVIAEQRKICEYDNIVIDYKEAVSLRATADQADNK